MGAHHSQEKGKTPVNLRSEQVAAIENAVKERMKGAHLAKEDLAHLFPHWGEWARIAYENISKKEHKLTPSSVVHLANLLEGISSEQAEALQLLFGGKARVALVSTSRKALQLSDEEAEQLIHALEADKTDSLSSFLISNRLAGNLIHLPLAHLLYPEISFLPKLDHKTALMNKAAQFTLLSYMPMEHRTEWALLFSSNVHGASFSQLCQRTDGQGACIVIVQTSKGRVFGGYASKGFVVGPTYQGDSLTFLFSLKPQLAIYEATGFTNKYCYLNLQQETMVNGLGIGGHDNVWPFLIKEDYGSGISVANSSAFEKCDLAGESEWQLHTVEVWRVGPPPAHLHKERSILDKDPQAQALLEIAGKQMHSEGFREAKPILDDESDHD